MRPVEVRSFFDRFRELFVPVGGGAVDTAIAPPHTSLGVARECLAGMDGVLLAAQNVHWRDSGAHTGEISPPMLLDSGVTVAIVGHSERRQFYGESDADVALRAKAASKHSLRPIVCVGESLSSFEAGQTNDVIEKQLKSSLQGLDADDAERLVVAYEPVWAIGTGRAATPQIIGTVHRVIREKLRTLFGQPGEMVPIIYGGSTTPENIGAIMACDGVDGALVGGASLNPETFWQLIEAGRKGRRSA